MTMLRKIGNRIELFNRCATWFVNREDPDEMYRILVEVFVVLIGFWVEAANWFRQNAIGMNVQVRQSLLELS